MIAALALLAGLAAAQPAPARDPRAPKDELKYFGSLGALQLVQGNALTQLWVDRAAGQPGPRRYYLTWTSTLEEQREPMLVFVDPSDGAHAVFPRAPIHLTARAIDRAPRERGSRHPFQVWLYGGGPKHADQGLYAAVWGMSREGDRPTGLQPILWWGLRGDAEPERADPSRAPALLKTWFGSSRP